MAKEIKIRPESSKPLVTENTTFRSRYDFEVTDKDLEQAQSELGETEEIRKRCLIKLKDMLTEKEDRRYRKDDDYLLRYLRWRKFDCDRACKSIKKFNDLRSRNPDFFSLPSNLEQLLNVGALKILPYRDEKGSVVFWLDTRKWNLDNLSLCSFIQVSIAVCDIISMNPSTQISSLICFWDLGGLSPQHYLHCINPFTVKTIVQVFQDGYPWRVRRLIWFNTNVALWTGYDKFICKFLKKQIADRIKFLGSDIGEVHKYLNPALLPTDYGGPIKEDDCSLTQLVMDNLEYLEYEHSFFKKREKDNVKEAIEGFKV